MGFARAMSDPGSLPEEHPGGAPQASKDAVLFQITAGNLTGALAWVRQALGWLTAGYVGGLILLLLGLEWWGERSWVFSVLLYAPIQICLLPLGLLTPLCLLFRWRLVVWHFAAI